ncbi:MAG: hypothetical protein NT118_12510 [Lentisphaerae bacterium]|nr:hypothetical protein [Lentisphaerota bacterium]
MKNLLKLLGLHPLVAFGMIVVDMMLFAPDCTGVGWLVSCAVAFVLTFPCILVQRFAYGDHWGIAIGKGMIVGILTAIPTPLPALVTGTSGVLGLIGMAASQEKQK